MSVLFTVAFSSVLLGAGSDPSSSNWPVRGRHMVGRNGRATKRGNKGASGRMRPVLTGNERSAALGAGSTLLPAGDSRKFEPVLPGPCRAASLRGRYQYNPPIRAPVNVVFVSFPSLLMSKTCLSIFMCRAGVPLSGPRAEALRRDGERVVADRSTRRARDRLGEQMEGRAVQTEPTGLCLCLFPIRNIMRSWFGRSSTRTNLGRGGRRSWRDSKTQWPPESDC